MSATITQAQALFTTMNRAISSRCHPARSCSPAGASERRMKGMLAYAMAERSNRMPRTKAHATSPTPSARKRSRCTARKAPRAARYIMTSRRRRRARRPSADRPAWVIAVRVGVRRERYAVRASGHGMWRSSRHGAEEVADERGAAHRHRAPEGDPERALPERGPAKPRGDGAEPGEEDERTAAHDHREVARCHQGRRGEGRGGAQGERRRRRQAGLDRARARGRVVAELVPRMRAE